MPQRQPTRLDVEGIEDDYLGVLLVAQEDAKVPWEDIAVTKKRVSEAFDAIFYNPETFKPFRGKQRITMENALKDQILALLWMTRVIPLPEEYKRYW